MIGQVKNADRGRPKDKARRRQAGYLKCSDIPDAAIITALEKHMTNIGASRWNVAKEFPDVPERVVSAKLNKMARNGVIDGCHIHHDCRGDFTLPEKPQVQP